MTGDLYLLQHYSRPTKQQSQAGQADINCWHQLAADCNASVPEGRGCSYPPLVLEGCSRQPLDKFINASIVVIGAYGSLYTPKR